MPAQIALVHDDAAFRASLKEALEAEGYTVACYPDALAAVSALSDMKRIELLITRASFERGRSNGASLALQLRRRKLGLPVIFVAAADMEEHVAHLGILIPTPVAIPALVRAVSEQLRNKH
jgi:DNA-binding response OmpR family regulator